MVNNMNERHPDRESYLYICNELIEKEICNYCDVYKGSLELIPNWKEEIWDKYVQLNRYCKDNYMKEAMGKIDRHKVAACYIIAIASVKPMRFIKKHEKYIAVNESLAITVGFSILRAFFLAMVDEKKSGEERKILTSKFNKGIKVPDNSLVNHGQYLDNFASELYFAISEGNINILSVAHELYLLEVITRMA